MTDSVTVVEEVYGKLSNSSVADEAEEQFQSALKTAEERASSAEEIGMSGLATQDLAKVHNQRAIAWCKARKITPLTEEDLSIWHLWLPTGYTSMKFSNGDRDWGRYQYFEGVPASVRDRIKEALPVFSLLEIRTPERQPRPALDPILLGHVDHSNGVRDTVLLARWGESDANFLSFEDIKRILAARAGLFDRVLNWGKPLSASDRFVVAGAGAFYGLMAGLMVMVLAAVVMSSGVGDYDVMKVIFFGAMGLGASVAPSLMIFDSIWVWWKKRLLRNTNPEIAQAV